MGLSGQIRQQETEMENLKKELGRFSRDFSAEGRINIDNLLLKQQLKSNYERQCQQYAALTTEYEQQEAAEEANHQQYMRRSKVDDQNLRSS